MQLVNHFGYLAGGLEGARVDNISIGLFVDSGLDCDTFNVVVTHQADAKLARPEARAIASRFAGRAFSWWVGPDVSPTFRQSLGDAGFVADEPEAAMSIELGENEPDFVSGAVISRVNSQDDLALYADILASNWSPPDGNVRRFYKNAAAAAVAPAAPLILLLARLEGQPVGTAEVALGADGVAGLYNVATLRHHRRRGVGGALTARAMAVARDAGMLRMELQASEDGQRLYRRLGFEPRGIWTEYRLSADRDPDPAHPQHDRS